MKNLVFLVDANNRVGLGHLSRCLELAKNLKKMAVTSYFMINKNSQVVKLIQNAGFEFVIPHTKSSVVLSLLHLHKKIKFSGLIIDSRKILQKSFFTKLNKICKIIVILNNNHPNNFLADLLVLPEIKEQYPKKILKKEKVLVGSKYALLGNLEKKKKEKKYPNMILISMGGSDKRELTQKIITLLKKERNDFHANIVLGKFFKNYNKILKLIKNDNRFTIIKNADSVIPYMRNADLGIFAFGITVYEALYCGLPSIVIGHSKENDKAAKIMSRYDCFYYLGYYKLVNFSKLSISIFKLLANRKLLKKYSENGKKLIDGKGSQRVTKEIIKTITT